MDYDKQADDFLKETETTFKAEFVKNGLHFEGDTAERDIYLITLTRGNREFKFNFGQSLNDSGLRLFHDKEKTERTRHKNFKIPEGLRQRQEEFNLKQKIKGGLKFGERCLIRKWFEEEHFKLCGLVWDMGKVPTAYSVLSGLTKSDHETFKDFCDSFGYDDDSIKAERIYKAVVEEWKNVKMLWSDEEIKKLQEIN